MRLLHCILSLLLGAAATQAAEERRPNIIVILADDLGHGDLSGYGSKVISTPRLDRISETPKPRMPSLWFEHQPDLFERLTSAAHGFAADVSKTPPPNIVLILADDLGYGDVRCYNDESKVATPNLDRLAREGMRFTDAHSPCTVCTPTRYSLMTGQMAFRVPNGGTVFTGVGGPSLIAPGRLTLPSMLRDNGYATACVGKWHVGMTFFDKDGQPVRGDGVDAVRRVDFSRRIDGGPVDHGFQSFFGTACCPTTDWLYAFIENDRVPVPPTDLIDKSKLPKHPYANDCRAGLIAPD